MQEPKLVASDVDGTLLGPTGSVTTRTRSAVAAVIASGTPFVLVSGRPPRWIPAVASAAGTAGYAVCGNGAMIYDIGADRVLAATTMNPMVLHGVSAALDEVLPGCALAAERVGQCAQDPEVMPFVTEPGYIHPWGDDGPTVQSRAEVLGRPAVKLLVRHAGMTSDAMAAAAGSALGRAVDVTFSAGGGLVEISAAGVTKATGLQWVGRLLSVPATEVLAFGDMPNDLSMLRWAGHGVAMANSHPEVLSVADEITASNVEDGVAQVLERWW
ncbi:MAG: HAD family hydrolase [Sciscionella sp.]